MATNPTHAQVMDDFFTTMPSAIIQIAVAEDYRPVMYVRLANGKGLSFSIDADDTPENLRQRLLDVIELVWDSQP